MKEMSNALAIEYVLYVIASTTYGYTDSRSKISLRNETRNK